MIKGIPVSEGYAIGKIYHYTDQTIDTSKKIVSDVESEITFFHRTIEKTIQQLEDLKHKAKERFGEETANIFEAHQMIAKDQELILAVEQKIKAESCNMVYALSSESNRFVHFFNALDDEYLKERSLDIIDVTKRMIFNASDMKHDELLLPDEEMILVASELTPSQIANINLTYVKGIITEMGGKTSHSAIIAKLLGIPTIMGVDDLFHITEDHQHVIMDAFIGEIYINYDHEKYMNYVHKRDHYLAYRESLKRLIHAPTISKDGVTYRLSGQIASESDVDYLLNQGAEGIGLFRTEFLFINRDKAPSEEEQYHLYRRVLEKMHPEPVVIRTIDVGGDKMTPYLKFTDDLNPSLGIRAIRLSIYNQKVIYEQLRALIRASIHGDLKIMFPMVASIEEMKMIQQWLMDIKTEFNHLSIPYGAFQVGIMIEVPSAALMADELAKYVDFFSLGTNDLIQYTFAADRTNQALDYLYRPFSPAIIKLISFAAQAAKNAGISISVCGEMASDLLAIPLLLGLGIDELSMSSQTILRARDFISQMNHLTFIEAANHVLELSDEFEIINYLKSVFQN